MSIFISIISWREQVTYRGDDEDPGLTRIYLVFILLAHWNNSSQVNI